MNSNNTSFPLRTIPAALGQMPGMTPPGKGLKPSSASILVIEDGTGSAQARAQAIAKATEQVVPRLESALAHVTWGYRVSRDIEEGESDEQRLVEGSGADLLREQAAVDHTGGGDADETFADSIEWALSDYTFSAAPDANKAVLLFQTSSTKPPQSGRSLEQIGEEFRERRIYLFVIGTQGSNMEQITDAAGSYGFFIELSENPSGAEAARVAETLLATMKSTLRQSKGNTERDTRAAA